MASSQSYKAFSSWGFAPQMENDNRSGSNLGVILGSAAECEIKHVVDLVRIFLEVEYNAVKVMLKQNRSMLDTIAERLLVASILEQSELSAIITEYNF